MSRWQLLLDRLDRERLFCDYATRYLSGRHEPVPNRSWITATYREWATLPAAQTGTRDQQVWAFCEFVVALREIARQAQARRQEPVTQDDMQQGAALPSDALSNDEDAIEEWIEG